MAVRLTPTEKLEFISNLAAMLSAGIPLLESVEALIEGSKSRSKIVLEELKKDLESGQTIADSLSRFPESFDPIAINLIRGAEESGNLEKNLKDLADTYRKDIEFNRKVKGALAYPLFVFVVFTAIMTVILTFVIPRISQVFSRLDVDLPLVTRFLIFLSGLLINFWPWIVGGLILAGVLFYWILKTRRRQILYLLSSLPFLSELAREIDLVRFSRSMALLLASGIPISKSLELSQNVLVRKELIDILEFARQEVSQGKKLSEALGVKKGVIPQILIRIVSTGERSGGLERSFQESSEFFDNRVSATIRTITTLLEPTILVVVGLVVGVIMLSIIAPIYQLIGSIRVGR
jgi:type II secretory pathway component PulF